MTVIDEVSRDAELLSDLLSEPLRSPPHREVRREGGRFVSLDGHASSPEYDWYWQLPETERKRLKVWMTPDGLRPDEWLSAMRDRVGDDLESAMAEWVLATKLADAAGTLRRGRDVAFIDVSHYGGPVPDSTDDVCEDPGAFSKGQIVGPQEVATMLAVKVGTIHQWRKRSLMPRPFQVVSGVPLWRAGKIEAWARETGRL